MASEKKRVRAEATVSSNGPGKNCRPRVPAAVREKLGARHGDRLIFVEGSMHAAEQAALQGVYFIVRLERAPEPVQEAQQSEAVPVAATSSPALEPLDEAVRRRLQGQQVSVGA